MDTIKMPAEDRHRQLSQENEMLKRQVADLEGVVASLRKRERSLTNRIKVLREIDLEIMRQHPVIALELLSSISFLRSALDIPYYHHERWDGSGYPRGLKGEEIPLVARIFAVVDVWDSLVSNRPYSPAWPVDEAREYIAENSGKMFDPVVVKTFFRVLENWVF